MNLWMTRTLSHPVGPALATKTRGRRIHHVAANGAPRRMTKGDVTRVGVDAAKERRMQRMDSEGLETLQVLVSGFYETGNLLSYQPLFRK
jgi:hypothetical protein